MDRHGLSEADAFAFIQQRAMGERSTMKAIAEQVLAGSARPLSRRSSRRTLDRGQAPPARRQLAHVPGVLRAADRHGHGVGPGHQRGVRVHVDADQPAARPPARRRRRRLRPARADVPPRGRRRLQGQPRGRARHPPPADGPRAPGRRDAAGSPCSTCAGLRGRRHHRHRRRRRPRPRATTSSSSPATATSTSWSRTRTSRCSTTGAACPTTRSTTRPASSSAPA